MDMSQLCGTIANENGRVLLLFNGRDRTDDCERDTGIPVKSPKPGYNYLF